MKKIRLLAAVLLSLTAVTNIIPAEEVKYPQPITVKDTGKKVDDFIIAKAGVVDGSYHSVIIRGDWPAKIKYPFLGPDKPLVRYLQVITGSKVQVVDYKKFDRKTSPYQYHIWLGRQPSVDKKYGKVLDKLDDEGYIIACEGKDLYIAGKFFNTGSHYAPYDLLERAAGCRWFFEPINFWNPVNFDNPTGPGEIIPPAREVKIPGNTYIVEEPTYKNRFFRVAPRFAWRLSRRDNYSHNLSNIINPQRHGKKHPEYFPLIKGKRYIPPASREYDQQPCVSNKDVTKMTITAAEKAFNEGISCFSLGMNDSGKYCECEQPEAMNVLSVT
ncbi:MAG: DUF4838 domain-containing protein [Planctomycetota bacterium]|jgi:hypothetical protein